MAEAVGARLISVARVPAEEARRRLLPFVAQQNSIQTQGTERRVVGETLAQGFVVCLVGAPET